jgi:RNA polymerase sigma factor (sigma-70 family)
MSRAARRAKPTLAAPPDQAPPDANARVASLYERHGAMVLAVCRRFLRDPVEAEDAAQQTFLSAQRALGNGSEPQEPGAWLATIARNECIARARARMREPLPVEATPEPAGPDVHADALRRGDVATIRAALASLPKPQRDAFVLRELRGLSYDEVALTLSLTPSAVESLLFRARRGLQLRLRSAWAALSPVGWVPAVRDLMAQLAAGSPAAGPVAAKAVAVGVGTVILTGGAIVGPHVLGHGSPRRSVGRPAVAAPARVAHGSRVAPARPAGEAVAEKPRVTAAILFKPARTVRPLAAARSDWSPQRPSHEEKRSGVRPDGGGGETFDPTSGTPTVTVPGSDPTAGSGPNWTTPDGGSGSSGTVAAGSGDGSPDSTGGVGSSNDGAASDDPGTGGSVSGPDDGGSGAAAGDD